MNTVERLITHFVPDTYQLSLTLQRVERRFSGTAVISGTVQPGSENIILHTKDLSIESILIDGKEADFALSDNDELYITQPSLSADHHTLTIKYDAQITDAMHGLYPCFYEVDGVKKELLATQFESHHAREVFPCIDEPEAKATFSLTLTTETNITVLSNMPIDWQREEDGLLVTSFLETPKMSTYLLAWVTGEMQSVTAKTKKGVEVNVWATHAQPATSLDFALDIAVRAIDFYEDYFGTDYPLPKSDHVALPDFSSGAMENWGLITYREIALLADPKTTSISSRQYIATVVAHELAHQWFGNLVTMKWWNNLWLNESFATLMEYIAVDNLEPSWNIWLDFTDESIMALRRDSIDGVQSVQTDVNHPDEISTLFDGAIVYAKGARLLRMLQHYVGDADFQKGLKEYFVDHAYGNTEADDLWSAIAKSSGKDITSLMATWISQSGYPVVSISQKDNVVSLSQEQFFVGPHEPSKKLWPIPLNASSKALPSLFSEATLTVEGVTDKSIRLNVEDSAHFITKYDDTLLASLLEKVAHGELETIDRMQLLHEATLLARGGAAKSASLLEMTKSYKNETTEQVWGIVALALVELRKFVESDDVLEKKLRSYTASMAEREFNRLGWETNENDSEEDIKLRSIILSMTLYGEADSVVTKAKEIYEANSLETLDPELRSLVLSSVVRNGDEATFRTLFDAYKNTQSGELRQDLCLALSSTKDMTLSAELLESIKDTSVIRPQDAGHWFVYLIRNKYSRLQAWQWIQDNWDWVIKTFSGDKSYDTFPRYIAGSLRTADELEEYKSFFLPMKNVTALTRVIAMGIKEIEGRVELISRDEASVKEAIALI